MKTIALLFSLFILITACGQPKQIWQTSEGLKQPESAVYSPAHKAIFVSNINGEPQTHDGNGHISMFTAQGRSLASPWMNGLNAPKGLAVVGEKLYVTDIDELVVIHIDKSVIEKRYPVKGAKFLNDVVSGPDGEIYFSDMFDNAIYVLKNDQVELFIKDEKLQSPNGLSVFNGKLYVASWGSIVGESFETTQSGHLLEIDLATKKIGDYFNNTPLGNLDGLIVTKDFFIVSDWMNGKIYQGKTQGKIKTILEMNQGSADISWIPDTHTLLIPQMIDSKLSAYKL